MLVPSAGGEPAAIETQRADVARIQSELERIDAQVGDAAEAYNGARYRLGQIEERIAENRNAANQAERELAEARVALAERLRHLYAHPEPDLAEVLVGSGSLGDAIDSMHALEQVSRQDTAVVQSIRRYRGQLAEARAELARDQERTEREVAEAEAQRRRVAALLREREAVLDSAQGELSRLLQAEERRQRAEAERQRQLAVARQQAQERVPAPAPGAAPGAPSEAPPSAPGPGVAAPASASAPAAAPAPAPLPSGSGNAAAAQLALQYLGVPYVWGGASPSGFDCSGLCSFVYGQVGKSVPHYTVAIYNQFPKVPRDQLQPGDMVFFRGLGHMGLYIGGGQMVHAPSTGDVVKITPISSRSDYVGAVRP